MRKLIATFALASAAVLAGAGAAVANDGPEFGDETVVTQIDHTVVVCSDFSFCTGDNG
ncbi:hypothetical protein [Streptomyces sp. NPDC090025]|uniref:hypothetical protein n=1 Tax=Streptomyces sp. NPDC090025 TaxID=3365922 RepID=UPI0038336F93